MNLPVKSLDNTRISFSHQISLHHGHLDGGCVDCRYIFHVFVSNSCQHTRPETLLMTGVHSHCSSFYLLPPALANLLFPALSLLAVGGILLLVTNMQVSCAKTRLHFHLFVHMLHSCNTHLVITWENYIKLLLKLLIVYHMCCKLTDMHGCKSFSWINQSHVQQRTVKNGILH